MTSGSEFEFDALSYRVIGTALEVHRTLGPGLLESTYHAAMRVALEHRGIAYESEVKVPVHFEGVPVGMARIDLLVEQALVVELKAVDALHDIYFAQIRAYLVLTRLKVGLLLNFNSPRLVIRRVVSDWKPAHV